MTKDDIIHMAREAGLYTHKEVQPEIFRFAELVAAAKEAEHKEAMRWDIHSCGPTCKRYACVATREAVAAEREACAMACVKISADQWALYKGRAPYTGQEPERASELTQGKSDGADLCFDAIMARGEA